MNKKIASCCCTFESYFDPMRSAATLGEYASKIVRSARKTGSIGVSIPLSSNPIVERMRPCGEEERLSSYSLDRYTRASRHVPASFKSNNLLKNWMVDEAKKDHLIARYIEDGTLSTNYDRDDKHYVDTAAIYKRYCYHRDPPSDVIIERCNSIGMTISMNYDTNAPSYVGLFLWPWGLWICCVDPISDRDQVNRSTLLDIMSKAAINDIPIIHVERRVACKLSCIFNDMTTMTTPFHAPNFVNLLEVTSNTGMEEERLLSMLMWKHLGIDIVTWQVRANIKRLNECTPKNPLFASFHPAWKLRWEQMVKLACDSLSCIVLFEHFIRLGIKHSAEDCS